jgi:DNA-binding CsgD family transcriptional regulator
LLKQRETTDAEVGTSPVGRQKAGLQKKASRAVRRCRKIAVIDMPANRLGPPCAAASSKARVAFVTVGQSPRDDIVPELLAQIGRAVEVAEFGALDGLAPDAVMALAPRPAEPSLSTRANGTTVVVAKPKIIGRVNRILARIERAGFDLTVLLSTGYFDGLEPRGALIEAERVIQTAIDSVAMTGQTVGIVLPLARQIDEYASRRWGDVRMRLSHAPCDSSSPSRVAAPPTGADRIGPTRAMGPDSSSPSRAAAPPTPRATGPVSAMGPDSSQLAAAARELKDCDLILLQSIAYTEAQRATVAAVTGRPVVLARRVLAGTMRLILSGALDGANGIERAFNTAGAAERMAFLTPREREIMVLVVDGLPNKAIGRRLGISPRTVEIHRANLMEKMGARSLAMLVRRAIELERAGVAFMPPAGGDRGAQRAPAS